MALVERFRGRATVPTAADDMRAALEAICESRHREAIRTIKDVMARHGRHPQTPQEKALRDGLLDVYIALVKPEEKA